MENNEKAINQMLTRTMPITDLRVECRSESATPRVISGYAVRFNEWSRPIWDDWVEMIDPGAFAGCDMSDVIMCTDHGTRCGDVLARSRNGEGTLAIEIDEDAVPVRPAVRGACEMLGYDPLQVANEGKMVAVVPEQEATAALEAMRRTRYGEQAAVIGRVRELDRGREPHVRVRTGWGATRILDMLVGEQLPRIC